MSSRHLLNPGGLRIGRVGPPPSCLEASVQTPGRRVWREKDGVL